MYQKVFVVFLLLAKFHSVTFAVCPSPEASMIPAREGEIYGYECYCPNYPFTVPCDEDVCECRCCSETRSHCCRNMQYCCSESYPVCCENRRDCCPENTSCCWEGQKIDCCEEGVFCCRGTCQDDTWDETKDDTLKQEDNEGKTKLDENELQNDAVIYNGVPNCMVLFGLTQPYYPWPPRGGGKRCKCDTKCPGYVYAWSQVGHPGLTKIGCASGNSAAYCNRRINAEKTSGTRANSVCLPVTHSRISYKRFKLNNTTRDYEVCNAGEVHTQDYLYCQRLWLGPDGIGKPPGATKNGMSEWFEIDLATAESYLRTFSKMEDE